MTLAVKKAENAWRQRGFEDAKAGRAQRAPLRDDDGKSTAAYLSGYRLGLRERGAAA